MATSTPAQHSEAQLCIIVGFEDADIPPLTLRGTPVALLLVENRPLLQHMLYFWRLFGYDDFVVLCPPKLQPRLREAVERWLTRQDEPSGIEGARVLVFSEDVEDPDEEAPGGGSPGGGGEDSRGGGEGAAGSDSGAPGGPPGGASSGRESGSGRQSPRSGGDGAGGEAELSRESGSERSRSPARRGSGSRSSGASRSSSPSRDTAGRAGREPGEGQFGGRREITSVSTLRAAIQAGCFNCDHVVLLSGSMFVTLLPPLLLRYHREADRACTVLLSNFTSPFRCNVLPDFKKCTKGCLAVQEYGSGSQTGVLTSTDINTLSRHQNFPLECVMVRRGLEKRQLAETLRAQQAREPSGMLSVSSRLSVGKADLTVAAQAVNDALELGFQKLYYQPGVGALESKRSLLNYLPLNLSRETLMHSLGLPEQLAASGSASLLSAVSMVNMFAAPTTTPLQDWELMQAGARRAPGGGGGAAGATVGPTVGAALGAAPGLAPGAASSATSSTSASAGAGGRAYSVRTPASLSASMVPPAYPLQCGKLAFYESLTHDKVQDQEKGFLVFPLCAPREDTTMRVYEQRVGLAIFRLSILSALVQVEGLMTVFDEAVRFLIEQERLPAAERHPLLRPAPEAAALSRAGQRTSPRGVGRAISQAPLRAGVGLAGVALGQPAGPAPPGAPWPREAAQPGGGADAYSSLAMAVQARYTAKAEGERVINELVHEMDDAPYPDPFSGEPEAVFPLPPGSPDAEGGAGPAPRLSAADLRRATSGVAFVESRGSPLLRLPVICCLLSDGKSYTSLNFALHHGAARTLPILLPVLHQSRRDVYDHVFQSESIIGRNCNFMQGCSLVRSTVDAYCMFGERVRLENCILGRNVTLSNDVELRDCILKDHVTVHSGCSLTGCILEPGVTVGRRSSLHNCMAGPGAQIRGRTSGRGMMFAG